MGHLRFFLGVTVLLIASTSNLTNGFQSVHKVHRIILKSPSLKTTSLQPKITLHAKPLQGHKCKKKSESNDYHVDRRQYLKKVAAAAVAVGGTALTNSPSLSLSSQTEQLPWIESKSFDFAGKSQVDLIEKMYPVHFREYLSRFLINHDPAFNNWWRGRINQIPSFYSETQKKQVLKEDFISFHTSIFYGLNSFCSDDGPKVLASKLITMYGIDGDSLVQLSQLFSMIPSPYQPKEVISDTLENIQEIVKPSLTSSRVSAPFVLDMLSFAERPLYDATNSAYFILDLPNSLQWFYPAVSQPPSREETLGLNTYALFALGGAFGCTLTHAAVIPLDVVKTRLQTTPGCYENLPDGVLTIAKTEGAAMLLQGAGPTMLGYLWYGLTVYPGYEFFKRFLIEIAGSENALLFRTQIVLLAGAIATFFACVGVCPAEAVRIRTVADPAFAPNSLAATTRIIKEEGFERLYDGFKPLLFRQVIFGMMKFFVFDFFAGFIYSLYPSLETQPSTALTVSLVSGLVAGVASCIVSQPADTILSTINKGEGLSIQSATTQIWREFGIQGFFLGLGSRCLWSGCVISGQFLLYDVSKTLLHVTSSDLTLYLNTLSTLK